MKQIEGEMISLSGNQTVQMWAIAACTVARVKKNNDDDKRTCKESSKTINQTKLEDWSCL